MNYELKPDEVILYEGNVGSKSYKSILRMQITLTSQNLIIERERGLFKKERELVDFISLAKVKTYNGDAQVRQRGTDVDVQTVEKNLTFTFSGILEARKFTEKMMDAITGTTFATRGSNLIKNAFDMVDDTLGIDTRETIKGVVENGVIKTVFKGIGKKK